MDGFRFSVAPLAAFLVFAASAGIIWLAHIEAGEMTVDRRPPLVKASTAPLKRSPDDPGGRAIADLGGVGDLLRDQPVETEERLLPRTEQPVTPDERGDTPGAALNPEARLEARAALEALVSEIRSDRPADGQSGVGGPEFDASSTPTSPARPPASPARPVDSTSSNPAEAAEAVTDASATEGQPAETDVASLSPTFEATTHGRYRVQLAAVRAENDAKRAWSLFQQQLGPFISGLQPFFERAETSNGTFYRVQVGPFGDTADADRLCVELKKQNASCFV
ncbi:MAG: SPOR domain-containing protein, partial [Geminicoccaceae bacterium]